jgi:hypothetical protein
MKCLRFTFVTNETSTVAINYKEIVDTVPIIPFEMVINH